MVLVYLVGGSTSVSVIDSVGVSDGVGVVVVVAVVSADTLTHSSLCGSNVFVLNKDW